MAQVCYDPLGLFMGEHHGILTADSDYAGMTSEEYRQRSAIELNFLTDIDCFQLDIYDATGVRDSEEWIDDHDKYLSTVILNEKTALELVARILTAYRMYDCFWSYSKDGAKRNELNKLIFDANRLVHYVLIKLESCLTARGEVKS